MQDNETFAGYAASDSEDGGDSPAQLITYYWGLLRKYYWIILITSILGVTVGYFWTKQQPRLYKTSSKVIFHQSSNVFGRSIERVDLLDQGGAWQFEQFWNTQREVLNSRWFAERVAIKLGMLEGDKHVPLTKGDGTAMSEDERLRMASNIVRGMIDVSLQRDSRVAVIAITSTDAQFAADMANGIAKTYVDYTREFQTGGLNQIINWFDKYVGDKRTELTAAQTALHKFKRDRNILAISFEERQNLTGSDMQSVNSQLNEVRNELAGQKAFLEQMQKMLKDGTAPVDVARFAENGTLNDMVGRRDDLRLRLADLNTVFGEKHESVRSVEDQLKIVEERIEQEIRRTMSEVEGKVGSLLRHEATLLGRLNELKELAFELNELGLEYGQLRDHEESLRQLYETVLKRSEELDINSMFESNNIQVLEEAERPGGPYSPNMPYNLGIALLVGIAFGGGIIFLIAALDNTMRSEEDVTRFTRAPVLGALPEVDAATLKGLGETSLDLITHFAPKSSFAEGIKTLRTNIMFMSADKAPRLLLVTSPGPGEGKTLISANMAIAFAQSGLRTIIVDNDLRRPRVHKALGVKNNRGVSEIAIGGGKLDELAMATEVENLWVLPAGQIPPNPTELMHTKRFEDLLTELTQKYDRVILDSPPIGAVADALILSRFVDAVLLVVKYGTTRRETFRRSIDQLDAIGAPLMGCVLNDIKKDAAGYGYTYHYYRYNYEEVPEKRGKSKSSKLAS
jgi:capsular exopolysaccharide synthesis family protein